MKPEADLPSALRRGGSHIMRPKAAALFVKLALVAAALSACQGCVAPGSEVHDKPARQADATRDAEGLIKSVRSGDAAAVRRLLSAGADPNVRDTAGLTPLVIAATRGDVEVAAALLSAGADANATTEAGKTPLAVAVGLKEAAIVDLLLEKGAGAEVKSGSSGATPLHVAARTGDLGILKKLLSRSRDVNVRDQDGNTPLMSAAGNADLLRALLDAGADVNAVNKRGQPTLTASVSSPAAVRLLIERGADVNARDADHWTPLQQALLLGCPETVDILKQAGGRE
jgi:ankyrin repeat protein